MLFYNKAVGNQTPLVLLLTNFLSVSSFWIPHGEHRRGAKPNGCSAEQAGRATGQVPPGEPGAAFAG